MPDPILQAENLSISLDGETILRDISFTVSEGELVAIIGPNGAGKTVLLKALLGFIPYTGVIHWREDVHIGYVPQRFGIDKTLPLTVREFFLLHDKRFLFAGGSFDQRIFEVLKMVDVSREVIGERLVALSGGQLQRVLVAWALVQNPSVLLFDEPTASIDVSGEETIYQLIHRLQDQFGITVLLVSHEINLVHRFATKVLCLNRALICEGTPSETLTAEQLDKLYAGPSLFHHLHNHEDS